MRSIDGAAGAAQVDGLAARARTGARSTTVAAKPCPVQPERQRRAGDAGAADECGSSVVHDVERMVYDTGVYAVLFMDRSALGALASHIGGRTAASVH